MNQQQGVYHHRIPRNGRDDEHCVRVGGAISGGTRSFERNVEEVGEEDTKREEWSHRAHLIVGKRADDEDSPRNRKNWPE